MRGCFSLLSVALLLSARLAAAECSLTETSSSGFSGIASGPSQIASLRVTCDSEYRIGLDAGSWLSGTRRLQDSKGNFIAYRLWQNSSGSQEWGENGFSSPTYAAPPLNAAAGTNTHPVFGSLPDSAGAAPGSYSDTVRVTLSWPPYGAADQQTASLPVSFSVSDQCSLDVSGIHGFGSWPTGGANLSGTALGSVSVNCSPGIHYVLGLDAGQNYDGSRRRLVSGGSAVSYTLRTSGGGPEWGDTGLKAIASDYVETHPAQAVQADGSGQSQNFFVWGDADISDAPAGKYADIIKVTVVW